MTNRKLFSEDSERAAISILLNNPSKLLETIELKSYMFSTTQHQILFDAIIGLSKSGTQPEPMILAEHLKIKNKLELVGDTDYIKYLSDSEYELENYREFENIIIESYKGRTLLNLSHKIPELVKRNSDMSALITAVKDKLGDLLISIGGEKTVAVSDFVKRHYEVIKERIANPGIKGLSTGFPSVNHSIGGASPGDLILIAARPSMGKTAWMISSALKSKVPSLIFSKEMNRGMITDRFISVESGIDLQHIRRGTVPIDKLGDLDRAIERIEQSVIFLDTNFLSDFQYIINTIRKYQQSDGIQAVYVDYVQLVVERDSNSTHEIGKVSRMLKLLANELGIVVYLISQLNRGVEAREEKRPVLSDLRQSGNLEEDSDIVIFLYRDEYYNEDSAAKGIVENIIRKNRNGPVGMTPLRFNPNTIEIIDDSVSGRRTTL